MKLSSKTKLVLVYAALILIILAASFILGSQNDHDEEDVDLVGDWHLVAKESYDQDRRYSTYVDPKYDIKVIGYNEEGALFNAESQGIAFCGAFINNSVVFEYRYGEETYVRADGYLEKGKLILYETHYYDSDYWFVAMSVYSKDPKEINYKFPDTPDLKKSWHAKYGVSVNGDTQYEIEGKRFVIQDQKGALFRAEMEQVYMSTVITRVMNGIFVSENNGTQIAFLMDESGKMWSLYITSDLVVLNTITHSEVEGHVGSMVATERDYYDGIPPQGPEYPDMHETVWASNKTYCMTGDGMHEILSTPVTMNYTVQNEHLFAGYSLDGDNVRRGEVAYAVVSFDAVDGDFLLRLGTQAINGDIKEGYGFFSDDGTKLHRVEFEYSQGMNGATYTVFDLTNS